ncbi:MAG: hypothetical protein EA396_06875 [Anaerolineaceae bacterium]|nr:MAG: hypothetical protein EA396_06875 [Anaerolineaceae bacterium]
MYALLRISSTVPPRHQQEGRMMRYTDEQAYAVYTPDAKNLVVVAGAGSGKTHVLVSRFLYLLEKNADWPLNAIVAITFTKKAAAEMRDRVRAGLEARYFAEVADSAEARRWAGLLAGMDSARIDTIHGLCGDLLRTNAAEAGIDPGFAILDEIDAALLLDDVIDDVILRAIENGDDGGAMVALLETYTEKAIRDVLAETRLHAVDLPEADAEALVAAWREHFEQSARATMTRTLQRIDALAQETAIPTGCKRGQTLRDLRAMADAISAGEPPDYQIDAMTRFDLRGGSKKQWASDETFNEAKHIIEDARDWARANTFDTAQEAEAARLVIYWSQVIATVRDAYRAAKQQAAALDFDDLERLTRELLTTAGASAVSRYRGREIKHLMVDEFQDTNADQWAIVRALADLDAPETLFVVGDPKQSIYAFRGADVSVFGAVCAAISDSDAGCEASLSRSFRTHRPLVQTFNHLFGALLRRDDESEASAYQVTLGVPMSAQRDQPPSDAPCVEMLLIGEETDEENAETRRRWEADEIASRIHALVAERRLIYDREADATRPVQYGDFAILFRGMTRVSLYEAVFKARGLPFITLSGRGYYDRQEVWDLQNALAAIYNPADDLALSAALRSPLFTLSDEALFALRTGDSPTRLWEAMQSPSAERLPAADRPRLAFAVATLRGLRGMAGRVTIAELLRELLARTGYMATLSALPDGVQRRANVEKLIEKAEKSGRVTLSDFLRYLAQMSDKEAREGEAPTLSEGTVNIMTVHASKGLEFPVVVLADASHTGRGTASDVVYDARYGLGCKVPPPPDDEKADKTRYIYSRIQALEKERETAENLRLLYVAATRAQDLLIVSGQAKLSKNGGFSAGGSTWLARLIEAFALADRIAPDAAPQLLDVWPDVPPLRVHMPVGRTAHAEIGAAGSFAWPDVSGAEPTAPPLTAPILADGASAHASAHHLAATHIADLGSIRHTPPHERRFYRDRIRRRVLYDAPNNIRTVSQQRDGRQQGRYIGQIVHEALRHWHLPKHTGAGQLERILTAYAWRHGITDAAQAAGIVSACHDLLERFERSKTYHALENARQVYREMPFIYKRDDYIIHGVIDVVYQTAAGDWVVADYKTGVVRGGDYRRHARRYHLQLGIYASALAAQLGEEPSALVHYIRGGKDQPVTISREAWREALADTPLDENIRAALAGDDDHTQETSAR